MLDHTPQNFKKLYPITEQGAYLKNASIAGMHRDVLEEIHRVNTFMAHHGAIHEEKYFELLMEVHEVLAKFLAIETEDVTLLENTSHNMNLLAMMLSHKESKERINGKNEIIVIEDEFPSNVLPFYHHGFQVIQVPSKHGQFNLSSLEEKITSKTAAIICSMVQFSTGQFTKPQDLSDLCQRNDIHLILNTTQAMGALSFNLKKIKVSAMTSSCHKWLGAGIGAAVLYLSPEFRGNHSYPMAGWCSVEEPFAMKNEKPRPRNDVMALQLGSLPFAVLAGVKKACEVQMNIGKDLIEKRILSHTHYLREELNKRGLSPLGNGQSGITTFDLKTPLEETEALVAKMASENIFVNCRRGLVRVSPHFFNEKEDLDALLQFLDKHL